MSRVAIVGGGVIGLCSAYSLRQRGFDVVVLDRGETPSTSTVNAGMIVPSHIIPLASPGMVGVGLKMMMLPQSPFWIRPRLSRDLIRWGILFAKSCTQGNVDRAKRLLIQLNAASKQAYLEFARELDNFHIEQRGLLMVAKEPSSFEEESHVAAQVKELGLPANVLDAAQLNDLDPCITMDAVGGVHYPADCHFSPPAFMASLQRRLGEMGVVFKQASAVGVSAAGVSTSEGVVDADEIVLAGGAWTQAMAKQIGLYLPLQAGKGYSFDVAAPPERPSICAILMERRVAVTPMPGGVRFGGTMEIGPTDGRIDARRVGAIRSAIPSYYPAFRGFDLSSLRAQVGLRPCSPDGMPYIGRTTRASNVVIATGHAMMGMSLGPITGRLVASLVDREQPEIEIGALDPDRFDR